MAKKQWIDESGLEIPVSRVTSLEKLKERKSEAITKQAEKIQQLLLALKEDIREASEEIYRKTLEENNIDSKDRKGNFTWHNFDRTLKIETAISERIDFDDATIAAAKIKFDLFLQENINGVDEMVRSVITDAFSTTRGKLDAKRIMKLVSHRQRIPRQEKYSGFHEAIDLIEKSIRKPESKAYFRVFKKNTLGEYENIDLNFSSL